MIWKVYVRWNRGEKEFAHECYANGVIAVGGATDRPHGSRYA